jgi:hypothetical protein
MKKIKPKKQVFTKLTKKQVEAERSTAYKYLFE